MKQNNIDISSTPLNNKQNSSLRRVFLTVVIATYFITILATLTVFYLSTCKISNEYVGRFALSQNMLERNRLLSIVDSELILSRKLADDPQIIDWMLDENNIIKKENIDAQLESYRKFLKSETTFLAVKSSGLYYLNSIKNTANLLSRGDPYDNWFYDTIEKNQDYSLNVDYNLALDEIKVWFNVIVRDNDGNALGIAGFGMDLSNFLDNMTNHKDVGIESILINSEGHLQAYKDTLIVEHNAIATESSEMITIYSLLDRQKDKDILREAIKKTSNSDKIYKFELQIGGKKVVATMGNIDELGWHNLVLVDGSSVIGFSNFLPLGIVFLASLLTVLFSIVLILNRMILRPLGVLTNAAGIVANGAYETILPQKNNNEIGRLSASFNSMTQKVKAYTTNLEQMVEDRTEKLNVANNELIESQKRITDSIQYAKLIQNSILPPSNELNEYLSDYFTILKPIDIVGGDFYFFQKTHNGFCIATVDCTGHGVPGAFMTMMTAALLNRVIETHPDARPAEILEHLHLLVQETLRSELSVAHLENGLDISLCMVKPPEQAIYFAGAGLPLIVVENNNINKIDGDKLHIGFSNSRKTHNFTEHKLAIKDKNRYYLITDGIFDLPGESKEFGLGYSGVKDLIQSLDKIPLKNQKQVILDVLKQHSGKLSQRDDMTIVGFSINCSERGLND